jgi:hypothetical protein
MGRKGVSDLCKVVCSWCKRHLKGEEKATTISHSICGLCLEVQLQAAHTFSRTVAIKPEDKHDIGGEG